MKSRSSRNNDLGWDDLKRFTEKGTKNLDCFATISGIGTITLNSGFIRHAKDQMDGSSYALLNYSRARNCIVLEFTDDSNEKGAVKITYRGNVSLAARSFFNHLSLKPTNLKGRYEPYLERIPKHGNCWVIDLNKKLKE